MSNSQPGTMTATRPAPKVPKITPEADLPPSAPKTARDQFGFEPLPDDTNAKVRLLDGWSQGIRLSVGDIQFGQGDDSLWSRLRPSLHQATDDFVTDAQRQELRRVEDEIAKVERLSKELQSQPSDDELRADFRRRMAADPAGVKSLVAEMDQALRERDEQRKAISTRREALRSEAHNAVAPVVRQAFSVGVQVAGKFDSGIREQIKDAVDFEIPFDRATQAMQSRVLEFSRYATAQPRNFLMSPAGILGDFIKF